MAEKLKSRAQQTPAALLGWLRRNAFPFRLPLEASVSAWSSELPAPSPSSRSQPIESSLAKINALQLSAAQGQIYLYFINRTRWVFFLKYVDFRQHIHFLLHTTQAMNYYMKTVPQKF